MDELEQLKHDNEILYRANCEISEVADKMREALEFVVDDGVSCPWETRERVAREALEGKK